MFGLLKLFFRDLDEFFFSYLMLIVMFEDEQVFISFICVCLVSSEAELGWEQLPALGFRKLKR